VRFVSCVAVSVQDPSGLCVPAERLAPAGTPVMATDNVSEPSVSFSPALICNAMAVSSLPAAACTDSVGASAMPDTVRGSVAVVLAVVPFSDDVAVTVKAVAPLQFAPGVSVRFASCAGLRVHDPSALCVPADSVAPAGRLEILTDSVSDPSAS